jgi:hypothetical protein
MQTFLNMPEPNTQTAVVFDGQRNDCDTGFSFLYLGTPKGMLAMNPDGDISIMRNIITDDLKQNDDAEALWRRILDVGVVDGCEMQLFEKDDPERIARITEVLAAAGLPEPWVFDQANNRVRLPPRLCVRRALLAELLAEELTSTLN